LGKTYVVSDFYGSAGGGIFELRHGSVDMARNCDADEK
jgi:hypothetical protein